MHLTAVPEPGDFKTTKWHKFEKSEQKETSKVFFLNAFCSRPAILYSNGTNKINVSKGILYRRYRHSNSLPTCSTQCHSIREI